MHPKHILITAALILASFGLGYGIGHAEKVDLLSEKPHANAIGGVFFKCKDPKALKEWYAKNLGLNTGPYGTVFVWRHADDSTQKGYTQWSPFKETTKYFAPSTKDFMINYRVVHLEALLKQMRANNVQVLDTVESASYGKFVHILDLEGNKVELWEPVDSEYGKIEGALTK